MRIHAVQENNYKSISDSEQYDGDIIEPSLTVIAGKMKIEGVHNQKSLIYRNRMINLTS